MKRQIITSTCNGETIRKREPKDVVAHWEALAYQAERGKDRVLAQTYFQQAEKYKKEGRDG